MANAAPTAIAAAIRARMQQEGIGQKALALKAGLNETYVRDILHGKSRHPHAAKLAMIAAALNCRAADLLDAAASPQLGELVTDAAELLLLATWRKLSQQERESVLDYVSFRLSRSADKPEPGATPLP
jgi:transcriptional regulator with XRE-family HTH domain